MSGWYQCVGQTGYPSRQQLNEVKARLWKAVLTLRDVMAGDEFDEEVGPHFQTCFPLDVMREFMRQPQFDPEDYVAENRAELAAVEAALRTFLKKQLAAFTADLYVDLVKRTQSWDEQRKWALL